MGKKNIVKVTLTPNTGVNLARTECFMKTFLRLNAEHFHPASIKKLQREGKKQKGFTEALLMCCSFPASSSLSACRVVSFLPRDEF